MRTNKLITTKGIDKSFPGVHALDTIDFTLKRGEVHALLGENGAGKSTFIKVLGGLFQPDKGEIFLEGEKVHFLAPSDAINKGISIIHQELNVAGNLTLAENIFYGRLPHNKLHIINRKKINTKSKELLKKVGLNIDPNTKANRLSIAQQQLLEIAKSLSLNAKIIIMDEPTSSLSSNEINRLFEIIKDLKQKGIGVIYISHKLDELFAVCDKVTVLRDGQKISTLDIGSTNENELIHHMVGRKVKELYNRKTSVEQKEILQVENLCNEHLKNISFTAKKGEIIGFSGLMGAGKTEISRAIFGLDLIKKGSIKIEGKVTTNFNTQKYKDIGVGYVPEDRKVVGIFNDHCVKTNMTISVLNQLTRSSIIQKLKEKKEVNKIIDLLKIKTPSENQKISNLSGGNQQKVILGRWLLKNNLKILIIDEPTRGIDVGAKLEIYHILSDLADKGVTILIMSSEIQELLSVCDKIIVLKEGQITAELDKEDANQNTIMKHSISS